MSQMQSANQVSVECFILVRELWGATRAEGR
jgi:hypothetical protein